MNTREEFHASLSAGQKARLARYVCGWCEQRLHRTIASGCGGLYGTPCSNKAVIVRATRCLNQSLAARLRVSA